MKKIKRPDDLEVLGQTYKFDTYIDYLLNSDRRYNANRKNAKSADKVETAKDKGGDLILEDEDAKLLKEVNEQPTAGYPVFTAANLDGTASLTNIGRKIGTFIDAISAAEDYEPPAE